MKFRVSDCSDSVKKAAVLHAGWDALTIGVAVPRSNSSWQIKVGDKTWYFEEDVIQYCEQLHWSNLKVYKGWQ